MPSSSSSRQEFGFGAAPEQRILALHRGDRLHRVCAADGLDARFRQPEVLDLALGDQVLDRAGDVLDRHVRVDAMLIEQVDAVGSQPLEGRLGHRLICSGRLLVPPRRAPVSRSMSKPNLVAMTTWSRIGCERLADQFLVGERAVGLGRVEEGHAAIVGGADQLDHLGLVGGRPVGGAHAHAAEAEGGDLEASKCSGFHHDCSCPALSSFPALRRPRRPDTASGSRAPWISIAADRGIQFGEFRGREADRGRADVLEHVRHLRRAGDGHDPRLLRHQPGQRDLRGSGLLPLGPALQQLDERQVVRQVLRREAGLDAANVTLGEARLRVDGAGQETHAERAPRHEADAEFLAERDDLLFRPAPQHRIFVLDGA